MTVEFSDALRASIVAHLDRHEVRTHPLDGRRHAAVALVVLDSDADLHGGDETEIERLNSAIRDRIQLEGEFLISPTVVHGRPVLRACIINHATRAEHVQGLLDSVVRIGEALLAERPDSRSETHVPLPDNL